ncbi:cyclase family protein [Fluviispira sanaruensis]|uniref:Cyclase n=1 Tax=Fluviispira sanaruensis TaxID=2493639 RepID=A0A4P2VL48_FLUSA|nr:cyclase family protein [Fluviispira sanaruensis]BBH54063.1 cyclase [Fluviispira sanaruensis]
MSNYIFLSHFLNEKTPSYGKRSPFIKRDVSKISCCQSSNSQYWEFSNHIGTHVDFPFHFDESGKKLETYSAKDWIFQKPVLIELECAPGYFINIKDLEKHIPEKCDIVFIKTSFEKFRNEDIYWENNPGVLPEVGIWLRKNRKNLKAIGFDFISLTSFSNKEIGGEAHKAFLNSNYEGEPLLIIEDMKLSALISSPKSVIIAPLLIEGADGSPVTVIAEI